MPTHVHMSGRTSWLLRTPCTGTLPKNTPTRRPFSGVQPARHNVRTQAAPEDQKPSEDIEQLRNKYFSQSGSEPPSSSASPPPPEPTSTSSSSSSDKGQQISQDPNGQPALPGSEAFRLNAVNPYALGRQARAAFDDLWTQVSALTYVTKRSVDESMDSPDSSFEAPQAAYTTVLVLGATGRVGRILVRKLLLRGYSVKALVRKREGRGAELPAAVQIVEGDLGSMSSCQEAVRDVNKVGDCSRSHRSGATWCFRRIRFQL